MRGCGLVSGRSSHRDRLRTIRMVADRHGVIIDPHTADGVKVALEHRDSTVPTLCLETAQPAKFADTIVEALGREPERPAEFAGLEALPQRCEVLSADADLLKQRIAATLQART